MKPISRIFSYFRNQYGNSVEDIRSSRPFFIILTLVLIGIMVAGLVTAPSLQQPSGWIPYIFLMVIHILLHWLSPLLSPNIRGYVIYLGVQGALAFILNMLGGNPNLGIGIYMALIGEAAGIFRQFGLSVLSAMIYLVLSGTNMVIMSGVGSLRLWAITTIPMSIFVLVYVKLFSQQMEARDEAQKLAKKLEEANTQLLDYALKIEQLTLEQERQRMARELHDTLSAGLAGTILQLEAADSHLASGRSDRAQAIIQQTMERARTALADARRVIDNLRAGPFTTGNMSDAIRDEIQHFESSTGIQCIVSLEMGANLSGTSAETVVRIIREGLTNIARHAHASQSWVNLITSPDSIQIEIRDNGCGFDATHVGQGSHYGLVGIRERARQAGGSFELVTAEGMGTTLRIRLPQSPTSPVQD